MKKLHLCKRVNYICNHKFTVKMFSRYTSCRRTVTHVPPPPEQAFYHLRKMS